VDAARHSVEPSTSGGAPDPESQRWLDTLGCEGPARAAALGDLHALLLRAARHEVSRRRATMPHLRGDDFEDVAQQSADDALVAVVAKLADYRGESRFTTWAYKFALYEAAAKLRRRAWQARELPTEPAHWPATASRHGRPEEDVEGAELLEALRGAIDEVLSQHQREVLVALALNGVPIDVLAERLHTTRGALYKTLHDARRKLRRRLAERGLEIIPTRAKEVR
jgi:RNA polymerase sigma-70 factor (ECF subfamily)